MKLKKVKDMSINEEILKSVADKLGSIHIIIAPMISHIGFTIQDGPIKEGVINGCQIDEIGKVWLEILRGFNKKFPCRENSLTITKIEEALMWQEKRTQNRIARGVEERNQAMPEDKSTEFWFRSDDQWHQVHIAFDQDECKLKIDGNLVATNMTPPHLKESEL